LISTLAKTGRRRKAITRTQKVYRYLLDYVRKNNRAPTYREIQIGCKLTSTSVVTYHLLRLAEDNLIKIEPQIARGIQLNAMNVSYSEVVNVPVLGTINDGKLENFTWEKLDDR
jgi:SOS-response transcriptional repressor LexA